MAEPRTPKDVFLALVNGVAEGRYEDLPGLYAEQTDVIHPFDPLRRPALRSRDELREHFTAPAGRARLDHRVANVVVHETADPEVIVAEFEYQGTTETGDPYALPGIFVLRVRDGEIVTSRDYFDHIAAASSRGQLGTLLKTLNQLPA